MAVLHCVLRRIAQEDRSRNETVPFAEFRNNEGVYVNGENESKMKHTKMKRHTHARTTEREWKRERMSRCAHNVFTSSQLNEAPRKGRRGKRVQTEYRKRSRSTVCGSRSDHDAKGRLIYAQ